MLIIRKSIPWISLVLLVACICITQFQHDQVNQKRIREANIPFNSLIAPSVGSQQSLRALSFGLNNVIADVIWLLTIQYYGGGDPYGKYAQLPKLIESIISLDPKFLYPYTFTGIVLPNEGFADQSLEILKKGETALPNEWSLPYYQGTILFINKKDNAAAAREYELASKKPGAPPVAEFLSAVQYSHSDDEETAVAIFKTIVDKSQNEYFKGRAQAYIDHYQLLHDLRDVISVFRDREKRNPKDLQELITKRYIREVPQDPLKRVFAYDERTGTVTADQTK